MMRTVMAITLILILLIPAVLLAEYPEYVVKRTTEKIVIDGLLDDPDWAKAKPVGDFIFGWWEDEPGTEQTEVKMLWDDDFLYVAFTCQDKHIWADHFITNTTTYKDDTVEIFWDPNPGDDDLSYNMFEINCVGNLLSVFNFRKFERSIHERASRIIPPHIAQNILGSVSNDADTDTLWVIETAIRFEDYAEYSKCKVPVDGTMWRMGLNRLGGKVDAKQSQWSPAIEPRSGFHTPEDFGNVFFSMTENGR